MSPLLTFAHTTAKGSTFSFSSLFNVTKLQQKIVLMSHRLAAFRSQRQWTRIFISLTTPMAMGTQLGFKRIERVIIHLSVPQNYGFDTIICDYFYRSPITTFTVATVAHK